MRNLLALLLFVPSHYLAQLPDYVPTNGLVAWYPLDGDATDESTLGLDGTMDGTALGTDRFGVTGKALYFDGNASVTCPSQNFPNGLTVSLWVKESEINGVSGFVFKYDGDQGNGDNSIERTFAVYRHGNSLSNRYYVTASETGVAFEDFPAQAVGSLDWVHLTTVFSLDGIKFYVNGVLDTDYTFNSIGGYHSSDVPITLGCSYPTAADSHKLKGTLDDIGIWDRALNADEVLALFFWEPLTYGCTDLDACNFQTEANADDGSCEYGCLYCGEGTLWNSTIAQCISTAPPCTPSCGEGTVWDPVNEECIIAIPADLNYDGCVTVNDLLVLLAVHGTCPPYPEWPDEPTDTTWSCGDSLTYWDYDYATVLIGDQCWFAENLATTRYTDGTVIDSGLSNSGWASTTTGAQSAYNDDDTVVSTHGRLYNGYAVDDTRGLCPTNWSVPTDSDFIHLEENLGMPTEEAISLFWRGSDEGQRLKSTTWQNGLDEVGFNALPCGGRNHSSGNFLDDGAIGYWWTQTFNIDGLFYRRMDSTEDRIFRTYPSMNYGFSVRCIKD